jgi:hypothetical protein
MALDTDGGGRSRGNQGQDTQPNCLRRGEVGSLSQSAATHRYLEYNVGQGPLSQVGEAEGSGTMLDGQCRMHEAGWCGGVSWRCRHRDDRRQPRSVYVLPYMADSLERHSSDASGG